MCTWLATDLQQRLLGVVVAGAVRSGHDGQWPPFATLALVPGAGAAV